jgi:hypothetical protein
LSEALNVVEAAFARAQADQSCRLDSDCLFFRGAADCMVGCGRVLSRCGAAALDAVIADVNTRICVNLPAGCAPELHSCGFLPGQGQAACLDGGCASFPPAAWASFAFEQQKGVQPGNFAIPQSCIAPGCTMWTVTPDARVVVSGAGAMRSAPLSAADFATVDAILRDPGFRAIGVTKNAVCDTAPPGQEISLSVQHGGGTVGFDVTGCVLVGPAGNYEQRLFDVVHTY